MQNTGQTGQQPPAPAPAKRPRLKPPPEFDAARIDKLDQAALVALLKKSSSTVFEKAKACQRLAAIGTKDAVPAIAPLLTHEQLGHYARYGLEPNPDPSADDALRAALPKVKGRLQVGVIHSIRYRKDPKAVDALAKLMYSSDTEVAQAAIAALGSISGPQATKTLLEGLGKTKGAMRASVAAAGLVCAEGLLAQGQRDQALSLYDTLSRPEIPKPVRLGAMHGIIAAEISLSRPRTTPPRP